MELLVVIAILVVLAGLLFPVFARAKKNSYRTSCASNIGQITKATLLYMVDSDDKVPHGRNPWDINPSPVWNNYQAYYPEVLTMDEMQNILKPYVGSSAEIYRSPADNGTQALERLFPRAFYTSPSTFMAYGSSYNYKTMLPLKRIDISAVKDPSRISFWKTVAGHWHGFEGPLIPTDDDAVFYRKQLGLRYNYGFADGRVEFVDFFRALKLADWDYIDID